MIAKVNSGSQRARSRKQGLPDVERGWRFYYRKM
jgi:hypothetical protein